ncbi:TrbG/VirB9 family P-type conjugative transfer protein [bacterium]|nr:TrbG/VirB9 family P-type conjugative transfer protein [bacterium]
MYRTPLAAIFFLVFSLSSVSSAELLDLSDAEPDTQTNTEMHTSSEELGDLSRIQKAFNDSKAFQNTLVYEYNALSTYKIRLRTAMDTLIILPEKEVISIFNFGDDVNFAFHPLKDNQGKNTNMGIIKNIHAGADTNLIIIGLSGNSYNFYLRTDDYSSDYLPHLKVFLTDQKISEKLKKARRQKKPRLEQITGDDSEAGRASGADPYRDNMDLSDYLRMIDNTPLKLLDRNQNLDFRYTIFKKGNVIAPMAVFDDGYWTYFRMSSSKNLDKVPELPAVLKVVSGIETPVNTRVVNNYIIAETTGSIFALRIDDRVLCVEKTIDHQKRFIK